MKKHRIFTYFVIGLVAMHSALASANGAPMLWKIEGATPHYLFGTIHLPDPRVTSLQPQVKRAFDEAHIVATEVELSTGTIMAMANASMLPTGQTLTEILPAHLNERVNSELKRISPQFSLAMFDRFKIWALAANLPLLPIQMKHRGQLSLDLKLAQEAAQSGKKTIGLEALEEQLGIFDSLTTEEQLLMLKETLHSLKQARNDGKDYIEILIGAYISGDGDAIRKITDMGMQTAPELGKRLLKKLLDDRNITMASRISAHVEAKTNHVYFFAVGAAHLVGKGSIVELLQEKGYTVTRVQ